MSSDPTNAVPEKTSYVKKNSKLKETIHQRLDTVTLMLSNSGDVF